MKKRMNEITDAEAMAFANEHFPDLADALRASTADNKPTDPIHVYAIFHALMSDASTAIEKHARKQQGIELKKGSVGTHPFTLACANTAMLGYLSKAPEEAIATGVVRQMPLAKIAALFMEARMDAAEERDREEQVSTFMSDPDPDKADPAFLSALDDLLRGGPGK